MDHYLIVVGSPAKRSHYEEPLFRRSAPAPARGELLVEPVQRVRMDRDGAVGQHFTPLRGDGDGLGVDIQADLFDTLGCE